MDYQGDRERIWKMILMAVNIKEVILSFEDKFLESDFLKSKDATIFIFQYNSLLIAFYAELRCILSHKENEYSLINFHNQFSQQKEIKGFCKKIINFIFRKNYKNSLPILQKENKEIWKRVKKYINKELLHKDIRKQKIKPDWTWSEVDNLLEDIKNCFNNTTVKNEKASYGDTKNQIYDIANKFFDDLLGNEFVGEGAVWSDIAEQFPQYQSLYVSPIKNGGIDNFTFRLGEEYVVKYPSKRCYALQPIKDHKWLPIIEPYISTNIPKPIALGMPTKNFQHNWTINTWIEGETLEDVGGDLSEKQLKQLATDLAQFIKELHQAPIENAPKAEYHNFHRGGNLKEYDKDTRGYIKELNRIIDSEKALNIWEQVLTSSWHKQDVWVHGDLAPSNIILKNGNLNGIIDFGCMAVGDPACDLVIAWTFFNNHARNTFMKQLNLEEEVWNRARGWALWKSCYELSSGNKAISKEKCIEIIETVCF